MEEVVTKEDLRQLAMLLLGEIRDLVNEKQEKPAFSPGWIKSNKVRKALDMSPGTLQNLRITGQVRFKKIMGAYYYSKADLMKLFDHK